MNLNDQYKSAVNFNSIVSDFAAGQLAAAKLSSDAELERFIAESCEDCGNHSPTEGHESWCKSNPAAKCSSQYCNDPVGTDGGIIDGDRYCAGCVANAARLAKGGR